MYFAIFISFLSLLAAQARASPAPAGTQPSPVPIVLNPSQQAEVVNIHNRYRVSYNGAPALQWNQTLADLSAHWSNQCIWLHGELFAPVGSLDTGSSDDGDWFHNPDLIAAYGADTTQWPADILDWIAQQGPPQISLGQNLFVSANPAAYPTLNLTGVVTAWFSENIYYNRVTGLSQTGQDVGHFTQVVWKDTNYVGCAVTRCPTITVSGQPWTNTLLVVCDYYPPGNIAGTQGV